MCFLPSLTIVRKKSGDKYCLFFVIEDGLESHHTTIQATQGDADRDDCHRVRGHENEKGGQPIIFPTIGISSSITNSPIKAIV